MTPAEIDTAYRDVDSLVKTLCDYCRESSPGNARARLDHITQTSAVIEHRLLKTAMIKNRMTTSIVNKRIYCNACICQIETSKQIQRRCQALGINFEPYAIETYCTLLASTTYSMRAYSMLSIIFHILTEQQKHIEFWRTFNFSEELLLLMKRSLYEYQNIRHEIGVKRREFSLELTYPHTEMVQFITFFDEYMHDLTKVFKRHLYHATTDVTELSRIMLYERPVEASAHIELHSSVDEH